MCSALWKLLTLVLLSYYKSGPFVCGYYLNIKVTPNFLVDNLCHRVEIEILDDKTHELYDSGKWEKIFHFTIQSNFMEWKFATQKSRNVFGWVVKKATFPFLFVESRLTHFSPSGSNNISFNSFSGSKDIELEIIYKTKMENIIPYNTDIVMKTKYASQNEIEKAYTFRSHWYVDCKYLGSYSSSSLSYNFPEADKTYEVVVVYEIAFNGQVDKNSPYECSNDTLTLPPVYTPQVMTKPVGDELFECKKTNDSYIVRSLTRMTITTIDTSPFTKGKINLVQDKTSRQEFVTTRDPVTISLQLEGKDRERFQKSKNNSIYWYGNCDLLNVTEGDSLHHVFWEHQKYELVAIVLSYFDGSKNEKEPFDCTNNRLQLKHYLCASAVFRKSFNVRETLITDGRLSLMQKGKPRHRFVSVNDAAYITLALDGTAASSFDERDSKTFWYQNCLLLGTSGDRNLAHKFPKAESEYKISAVIVITHNGSHPINSPYNCSTDALRRDEDHAVGVFHSYYFTRDLWIPAGHIELVQNGVVRPYIVAIYEQFNVSIKLDASDKVFVQASSKNVAQYWFFDCVWVGTSHGEPFQFAFDKAFHQYSIVGVGLGTYNGTPPTNPPYDCITKTLQEDVTYSVGAFHGTYLTRVLRLTSTNGKVELLQSGNIRSRIVGPNVPFRLSLHLEDDDGGVFKHTKINKTFWYKNCTPLGSTLGPNFESNFNEANQTHTIVGVLVSLYKGTPPVNPPYDCLNNTITDDTRFVVGVYEKHYFTRDLQLLSSHGKIVLVQGGHTRKHIIAPNLPFTVAIKLDNKYENMMQNAQNRNTLWYSNCTLLGDSLNESFEHKYDQMFQKNKITGVVVLTHAGSSPVDKASVPYHCHNNSIVQGENYTVGVFHSEYITRATKLDNGQILFKQNGIIRGQTVATENLNMILLLDALHKTALDDSKVERIYWHRNCTLIGVSTRPDAVAIFRQPYRTHEIVGVLVAVQEGEPPEKSPYICANKTLKLNVEYTVAAFFGIITTKDPIRSVKIEGETTIKESEKLNLHVSFTGTPPYEYCVLVFEQSYKQTGKEECEHQAFKSVVYKATKLRDNTFEYGNNHEMGKRVLLFIIKNEVSKEIKAVPIYIMPVLQTGLKCLGGCD